MEGTVGVLQKIHSLSIRDFVLENHTDQPCAKFVNRGEIKNFIYMNFRKMI